MEEQYLTETEVNEMQRLLRCLNGLKTICPNDVRLYDSNGECLGALKICEAEEGPRFGFHYYMPGIEVDYDDAHNTTYNANTR